MQTFLPYSDFTESALSLDRKRLGKQRVECLQILQCLIGLKTGWKNHPAVKMWKGYEFALTSYGLAVCSAWIRLGYKDTCRDKILELRKSLNINYSEDLLPPWLGDTRLHGSHKAKLLQKNYEFYRYQFSTNEIPFDWKHVEYFWPTLSI